MTIFKGMSPKTLKNLYLFLSLLLVTACVHAPHTYTPTQKTFLWKASSENATVYLLGSIHLAQKDLYPLHPRIEKAFEASDTLVVEARVDQVGEQDIKTLVLKYAQYPPQTRLINKLSEETYEMARNRFLEHGVNIGQLARFKPWFLALNITNLEMEKLGFNQKYGIDRYFMTNAERQGKTIDALETVEYQIKVFSQIDDQDQEQFLKYTLINLETLKNYMGNLFEAWQIGNTEEVLKILNMGFSDYPEMMPYYEKFVDERNRAMSEKIAKLFQTNKTYFVVVGAAHLVGQESIPQLLKAKGFSVEQR